MEIKTNSAPAIVTTSLRYAATGIAGYLVQEGIVTQDDQQTIIGAIVGVGCLVYGAYKTWSNKRKLVEAAMTPPRDVDLVK